jgi:multicomponent K+:H+ antiporter subunit D
VHGYLLGNWRAPFGIALALDRLSALMLMLTALVGLAALLYARGGDGSARTALPCAVPVPADGPERRLPHGRPVQPVRLLRGAADRLYGLLLHGAAAARAAASVHYVVFNLAGSALFLIAVSLLYGSPAR